MKDKHHIAELIVRRIKGQISLAEQEELDLWIKKNPENQQVFL